MNKELKRILIDKGYYSENDYPFAIKPNFSPLGSIIQIQPQGSKFGFVFADTIRNLLGFNETILYEEYNISPKPVDILSFDNIFIHTDIAQGKIFKGKKSGIIRNLTMDVHSREKHIEKFRVSIQGYMMDTKDFISIINFNFENENVEIVSFNGQSVTFRLSIKEV